YALTVSGQRCTPHIAPGYSSADLRAIGIKTLPIPPCAGVYHVKLELNGDTARAFWLYQKREIFETTRKAMESFGGTLPCAHGGQCAGFYLILRTKNTKCRSALTCVRSRHRLGCASLLVCARQPCATLSRTDSRASLRGSPWK